MSQICYHGTHLAHVIVPQGKTFNKLAYTNFLMNNSSFTFCTRENVIKRTFSEKTENCIISFALYSSFKKLIIPRHDTLYKRRVVTWAMVYIKSCYIYNKLRLKKHEISSLTANALSDTYHIRAIKASLSTGFGNI